MMEDKKRPGRGLLSPVSFRSDVIVAASSGCGWSTTIASWAWYQRTAASLPRIVAAELPNP
jgi:hypothetical protein